VNWRRLKNIIWKELLDLSRDKRTIFAAIIVPIIFYPTLGGLIGYMFKVQPAYIAIIDYDKGEYSEELKNTLLNYSKYFGNVNIFTNYTSELQVLENPNIDLTLIIPKGFTENITKSLNGVGIVYIKPNVVSSKASEAQSLVEMAINALSNNIVRKRIKTAIPNVEPERFLNPIKKVVEYIGPGGRAASPEERFLFLTLMIFILGLYFSMHPAIAFVTDSVAGEKERKTLEALLVTPASRIEILGGKLIASLVLSGVAAGMNTLGVFLMYTFLFGGLLGVQIPIGGGLGLIGIYAIDVFLTVTVTVSIALLVSIVSGSVRSAHSNATALITVLALVMFASIYGDLEKIASQTLPLLYLIPYTHSVLALVTFVKYENGFIYSLRHLLILAIYALALITLGAKLFSGERILIAKVKRKGRKFKLKLFA